eukprot:scaffold92811_cov69-Phaeocystis_antarctica.AAC.1
MVNVVPALTSVKTVKVQSVTLETKTCKYFAHTLPDSTCDPSNDPSVRLLARILRPKVRRLARRLSGRGGRGGHGGRYGRDGASVKLNRSSWGADVYCINPRYRTV